MTSTKFLSSHGAAVNVRKTQRMAAKVMQLFNSPNKLLTTLGNWKKMEGVYIFCVKGMHKPLYENIEEFKEQFHDASFGRGW